MPHTIEIAPTGRAKCRACEQKIGKGELRFGERLPNVFGEGEMTLWFHMRCAAYKRPEPFLEALHAAVETDGAPTTEIEDAPALEAAAEFGVAHRRVPRINGADLAPTGRARCKSCRETIDKGTWRIVLVFFEEYRFQPSGFIHAACARDYFETTDVIERVRWFSRSLGADELESLRNALDATPEGD
jgi:hypothetical protein